MIKLNYILLNQLSTLAPNKNDDVEEMSSFVVFCIRQGGGTRNTSAFLTYFPVEVIIKMFIKGNSIQCISNGSSGKLTCRKAFIMKTRIAVISIIVEDTDSVETLNTILFSYREYIIGRMGIPYKEKKVNLISIAIDAPEDKINALTGKIGKLNGVSAKINYSGIITEMQ